MSKYNAKKTMVDGLQFDSKSEAARWCNLVLMEKAGLINGLQRQVKFLLIPKQRRPDGRLERECTFNADFQYFEGGVQVVEDRKGFATKDYIIKRKLMLSVWGVAVKETRA